MCYLFSKLRKKLYIVPLFLILFCSTPEMDETTVAIVGKDVITTADLIMSYELLQNYTPSEQGEKALRCHLELLIQKKLFAQQGRRQGYENNPDVKKFVDWTRKEQLRKALYRKVVEDKIQISEHDLLAAFQKDNIEIRMRHLFAKTEKQVRMIQDALNRGVSWEELAKVSFNDSVLASNGGDLGWHRFGEMEPAFEDTVFALPVGRISQPVRTRFGYHLIQVLNKRKNIFLTKDDFENRKPSLKKILVRREEKKLSSQFIKKFWEGENVEMINKTFNFFVSKIRDKVIDKRFIKNENFQGLKDVELNDLKVGLEPFQDEVLVTYKNGQWTIGDFLDKLRRLPITQRPRMDSPTKFRHDLGIMIRNELLTEQAKRQRLETDAIVQKEVKYWEDEYIFSRLWNDILDTLSISEQKANAFFEKHRSRYWIPDQVWLREILVRSKSQAQQLLEQIKSGAEFNELAKKYSLRKATAEKGGDLGWLERGQMGNISLTALKLDKGEVSKPIKVSGGYSIIKVLGKKKQRNKTFDEAQIELMNDVRHELSGTAFEQWVEKLKAKTTIQINDSLLIIMAKQITTKGRVVMPGVGNIY